MKITKDIIDSLLVRFVLNFPESELEDKRLLFRFRNAYWYYLDYLTDNKTKKRGKKHKSEISEKAFFQEMHKVLTNLGMPLRNFEDLYEDYQEYDKMIGRSGAVIMNRRMSKTVLVKHKVGLYGFPKGKMHQGENFEDCAVREVSEETGLDISGKIKKNWNIEVDYVGGEKNVYFVVNRFNGDEILKPIGNSEIDSVEWFDLKDLGVRNFRLSNVAEKVYAKLVESIQSFLAEDYPLIPLL